MTYQYCGMALCVPTKCYILKNCRLLQNWIGVPSTEMQMFCVRFEMLTLVSKQCCLLGCGDATW